MGILIGLDSVSHEWPGHHVLDSVTIGVYEGDRIGVVGRNGEGKSTLVELAAKLIEPDEGSVTWRNNISVGVLAQRDALDDADTVLHQIVGDTPVYEWASSPRIRGVMDGLLQGIDPDMCVGELSGGQRRRVDLCRLLAGEWDVILLDEPTNHLDIAGITWLANHLNHMWQPGRGALLIVTHDRWFLDEVCTTMWEVHDRRIESFEGGFSAYVHQRVERERQEARAEERRQNTLRRELAWLSRGAQARTSKAKFRIAEAQALIADVPPLRNPLQLKQLSVARLGKQVVEFSQVQLELGGVALLHSTDWIVGPGDRIGILGANGVGKTSLLNLIAGHLQPTQGSIQIGKTVRMGILTQRLEIFHDREDWRITDILARHKRTHMIDGKEYTSERLLEMLGFSGSDLMSEVGDLSGGQRRRLALLLVLLDEPNVLLLDEPGNDLDTDMLAVLEDLLDRWPGTLILVTHDRYLMERVTDNEYALVAGHLRHVPRGVDEYLELVRNHSADAAANNATVRDDARSTRDGTTTATPVVTRLPVPVVSQDFPAASKAVVSSAPAALSNKERRELKKRLDSVSRRMTAREERPHELRLEMEQADPSDYRELERLQNEIAAAEAELEELETEWLELSELLGE